MPPQFDLVLPPLAAVVSGGLAAARMAGFVAVGSLPLARSRWPSRPLPRDCSAGWPGWRWPA